MAQMVKNLLQRSRHSFDPWVGRSPGKGNGGINENSDTLFSWAPTSLRMVNAAMKLRDACSLKEKL